MDKRAHTKQHTWTLTDGRTVTVTASLIVERTIDDNLGLVKRCCDLEIAATVDGLEVGAWLERTPMRIIKGVEIAGTIGRLAVPSEQMPAIDAMIEAIQQSPEWRTAQAQRMEREASLRRDDETLRRIDAAMVE